jgi:hypothetical protein
MLLKRRFKSLLEMFLKSGAGGIQGVKWEVEKKVVIWIVLEYGGPIGDQSRRIVHIGS